MEDRELKAIIESDEIAKSPKHVSNPSCVKLPHVARLLSQMNSSLEAKSQLDKGTIFQFKISAMTSKQKSDLRQQSRREKALNSMNRNLFGRDLSNNEDITIDFEN